jgi:hypothetical protein
MVDLLGMFRRRPAKRGRVGFARTRDDITALGDSIGNMLTSPVRDAPPIARGGLSSSFQRSNFRTRRHVCARDPPSL